jgi:hypothetical protein
MKNKIRIEKLKNLIQKKRRKQDFFNIQDILLQILLIILQSIIPV